MSHKTPADVEDSIVAAAQGGHSGKTISALFNVPTATVSLILKRNKIETKIGRIPLPLDHNAFDALTPESLYWIGFIFADGHVRHVPKKEGVQIGLAEKDEDHLKKFRSFLKSEGAITRVLLKPGDVVKRERHAVFFSVHSAQIARALGQHGLTKNKATRIPPNTVASSTDFWRGMVDGDGTVAIYDDSKKQYGYRYSYIGLYGRKALLDKYQTFLASHGIHANISKSGSASAAVLQVALLGSGAVAVTRLLYEGATTFLERKMQSATAVMAYGK